MRNIFLNIFGKIFKVYFFFNVDFNLKSLVRFIFVVFFRLIIGKEIDKILNER